MARRYSTRRATGARSSRARRTKTVVLQVGDCVVRRSGQRVCFTGAAPARRRRVYRTRARRR